MNPARLLEYEGDPEPEPAMDELQQLPGQMLKLAADVDHIQKDVAEIKVQLLGMDDRMRAMDERLCGKIEGGDMRLEGKIAAVATHLEGKIEAVEARLEGKITAVETRLEGKIERLDSKIDRIHAILSEKIDALQRELSSAKVWAFGLYVAQGAGLLLVMAKGFKWI
jgi:chromosome segregation ATPase